MWGLIASGLLIVAVFVGYEAAMKSRNSNAPTANTPKLSGQANWQYS